MKIIEFIGLPGSGKSTILNKVKSNSKFYKKFSYTYKDFLFNINTRTYYKKILFFFIKKNKATIFIDKKNKNLLKNKFKNLYMGILIKLISSFLKNSKNNLFYKSYKKILDFSAHSPQRIKRMEIYFLLKILSFGLSKKFNNKNYFIFDDEGFYQNILIKYKDFNINKIKIFNEIKRYIHLSPRPSFIILIDNKNKQIIKRANLRTVGYTYYEDDLVNNLKNWDQVKNFLINCIQKKNIKMVKINNMDNLDKLKIKKLIKILDKVRL
tara:strand:+ start:592 stop:1392 length:801 start_codon:yes stop_codon:yes gene_type:complete